jgi:glutathione synthase
MNLLFVTDPLELFKIYKDTTFSMMREAQRRGHRISACGPEHLAWRSGDLVRAEVREIRLTGESDRWFLETGNPVKPLNEFDAVIMRKDPQFTTPTLVTRDAAAVRAFHDQHRDIILKPLDGMGGMGIYRVKADGLNLGSIIETLNHDGATSLMVQKFVPQITEGDKRVLVIGGQPVPYSLARIPQGSEVRGNLAAGGKGVAQPLSARDREIAEAIGPVLAKRGLLLVGLDVIGDSLTEINVTSPTCFQEITEQTGFDVPAMFIDALEAALA